MELNQPDNQPQLVKQITVYEIEDGEIDNSQVIKLILLLSAIQELLFVCSHKNRTEKFIKQ